MTVWALTDTSSTSTTQVNTPIHSQTPRLYYCTPQIRLGQVRHDATNTPDICRSCLSTAFPVFFLRFFSWHEKARQMRATKHKQRLWSKETGITSYHSQYNCTILWKDANNRGYVCLYVHSPQLQLSWLPEIVALAWLLTRSFLAAKCSPRMQLLMTALRVHTFTSHPITVATSTPFSLHMNYLQSVFHVINRYHKYLKLSA